MKCLKNEDYLINYPEELEHLVKNAVDYSVKKKGENCKIFHCKTADIPQLKASIFIDRKKFVDYIKKVSGGQEPPEWATGCFYNGEIQIFANPHNKVETSFLMGTIAHETVHLMFNKLIYEKYKIDRLVWLDESFANYLDGIVLSWRGDSWDKLVARLLPYKDFNVNNLNNRNKVVTKNYDGYDMFRIIGKYICENNLAQEYLQMLKTDRNKVMRLGKTILKTAINWFVERGNS